MPDCLEEHRSHKTCPFLELHQKLDCEDATAILNQVESCQNVRLCCSRNDLINNGQCDAEISEDMQCSYDYLDCNNAQNIKKLCEYAVDQSKLDCGIADYMKESYPICSEIQVKCDYRVAR